MFLKYCNALLLLHYWTSLLKTGLKHLDIGTRNLRETRAVRKN